MALCEHDVDGVFIVWLSFRGNETEKFGPHIKFEQDLFRLGSCICEVLDAEHERSDLELSERTVLLEVAVHRGLA